ncbi:cupin domain-containing protein [Thermosulfuriphilus sp.]
MAYFYTSQEIHFEDHPKFAGVKIAILINHKKSPAVSVSLLEISPGVEIPIHTHDTQADSIYVLDGKGLAYVNGTWQEIGQGDYIFVPPKEEHAVRNEGEGVLRLFIVHSPPLF